ncbi:hypothetical protein BX070DRAFT_222064 [Coemansia spiralis]|nr:hypothetical protein BX070DRAFT_222064 [Coemansia spiralis]
MFGQFFNIFGLQDSEQKTTPDRKKESEQKRLQIQNITAYLKSAKVRRSTYKKIVESTRQAAEVVVWCDRHNPELLSYTIEVGLHHAMLRLLYYNGQVSRKKHADKPDMPGYAAVAIQTLQTFSIILDGITDAKYLYSLFSNNFVNDLIAAPVLDADNEEVLAYYVAFLKALSLRLTPDTIHFFFNERLDDFPLYTTAIRLFDHPDSMVRVAVRAITLNVFRINNKDALEFILSAPQCAHFWEQVMCALKDTVDDAFRILVDMQASGPKSEWAQIDLILEKHMGLLAYLNDIYGLGVDRINTQITSEFVDRILVRTYVHAIEIGWRADASAEETLFMQVVSLFIAHFFSIVKYSELLADTMNALFVPNTSNDNDNNNKHGALEHPFIPSPFEHPRTLAPWLCIALEVLNNKAISPSTIVKSVLTPRRMLRTRALLDSLTGTPDCCSSASNQSISPDTGGQLPPFTQTVVTAMVQVLTSEYPVSWVTVDLAALLLTELCKGPRGQIVLANGPMEELVSAQRVHSAELCAMLLSVADKAEEEEMYANCPVGIGLWKVLAKCLIDIANTAADTLRIKAESEGKHIFAPTTYYLADSASRRPSNNISPPQQIITPTGHSSPSSASLRSLAQRSTIVSPFESTLPREARLEARIHQAHNTKALVFHDSNPIGKSYLSDLRKWAGSNAPPKESTNNGFIKATIIDNNAKPGLMPRSATRLGVSAQALCHEGCLFIWLSNNNNDEPLLLDAPDLVWPLADILVSESQEYTDAGTLPTLKLIDTVFPQPFFPPRPHSLGGININNLKPAKVASARRSSEQSTNGVPRRKTLLQHYSYFGSQRGLNISLRFLDHLECADAQGLLQTNALVSRSQLANIFLNYNVI